MIQSDNQPTTITSDHSDSEPTSIFPPIEIPWTEENYETRKAVEEYLSTFLTKE